MPFGIGSGLGGLGAFLKSGAHVFAWDTAFDFLKGQFKEEVGKKVAGGILKNGAKWGGLDRSDDQLLAVLYVSLHKHYEAQYDELREALDVLWAELLAIDNGRGKWAKRWRMTFVGIPLKDDAEIPKDGQKLKEKILVLHKKTGEAILGPDGQPLYHEKYEGGKEPLALSKEDPRVKYLYMTAKMAREELDTWNGGLRRAGAPELPNTINHLMVTYLQDDPFFKLMGEKWRLVMEWVEGRNPLTQGSAWMWLSKEQRAEIDALALSESEKTTLRTELVTTAKAQFEGDLRNVQEESFWRGTLRFWWLLVLPAALWALLMMLPAR